MVRLFHVSAVPVAVSAVPVAVSAVPIAGYSCPVAVSAVPETQSASSPLPPAAHSRAWFMRANLFIACERWVKDR